MERLHREGDTATGEGCRDAFLKRCGGDDDGSDRGDYDDMDKDAV